MVSLAESPSSSRLDAVASDVVHAVLAEIMETHHLVTIEEYDALTGYDNDE
jgi:hypothetical protein